MTDEQIIAEFKEAQETVVNTARIHKDTTTDGNADAESRAWRECRKAVRRLYDLSRNSNIAEVAEQLRLKAEKIGCRQCNYVAWRVLIESGNTVCAYCDMQDQRNDLREDVKTLKAERDALAERVRELEAKQGMPDWQKEALAAVYGVDWRSLKPQDAKAQ